MEEKSNKKNLSEKDQEYLNNVDDSFENILEEAVSNGLEGISNSQSSKAIKLDKEEINSIQKKKEAQNELTTDERVKLSISDIQSGKFKNFFKLVDQDLSNKHLPENKEDNNNQTQQNNEKES